MIGLNFQHKRQYIFNSYCVLVGYYQPSHTHIWNLDYSPFSLYNVIGGGEEKIVMYNIIAIFPPL